MKIVKLSTLVLMITCVALVCASCYLNKGSDQTTASTNATELKDTYYSYYWYRK